MAIPSSPSFGTLIRTFNPYSDSTIQTLRSVFGSYGDTVLNQFKSYYVAKNAPTPVQAMGAFFRTLDGQLSSVEDPGIVSGWVKFFDSQGPLVRQELYKLLPSPSFLGKSFPTAANGLVRPENIYSTQVMPNVPNPNAAISALISTGMEVPGYIATNLAIASRALLDIYNSNISFSLDKFGSPDKPHMGNLVPDSKHIERIVAAAPTFVSKVISFFGDAANYMAKNLGFNQFGVDNKNISSPNYKLEAKKAEQQSVLVTSSGSVDTRDVSNVGRYKPRATA
jgi:hypothetical protein